MQQDLLAPPKLTVRRHAMVAAGFGVAMVLAGVVLVALGRLTLAGLGVRVGMVAGVLGGAVWLHAKLLRLAVRTRPERMPWLHAATFVTGFGAFLLAMGMMLRGTLLGGALVSNWWQVPAMFGMVLAAGGWGRRVGESMHCPRCEYVFKFDHPEDAPIRCPECGTGWLGLLKKGRKVRSPRLIAGGIALAFTAMVLMQPIFYMGWLAPHLPTPLLFASLYASPKSWHTVWDELAARPLDAWSVRAMAERVLRQRQSDQYDGSPSKWFEAMAAAGKVPKELVQRFYREGFEAELVAPERIKAGEPFTVNLRVTRVSSGFAHQVGVYFGGYWIGDETARTGRLDRTLWAHEVRSGVFEGQCAVQAAVLRADKPGEVRVRVEFWVVYQPSFTEQLAWRADGTPARPPSALWFERYELERTVHVE